MATRGQGVGFGYGEEEVCRGGAGGAGPVLRGAGSSGRGRRQGTNVGCRIFNIQHTLLTRYSSPAAAIYGSTRAVVLLSRSSSADWCSQHYSCRRVGGAGLYVLHI